MGYVVKHPVKGYCAGYSFDAQQRKANVYISRAEAVKKLALLADDWPEVARIVRLKPKPKPYAPGSFTVGVSRVDTKECDGPRFDLIINNEVVDSLTSADAANIRAGRILRALKKTLAVALAIPMPVVELVQEPAIGWSVVKVNGVDISTTNNQDHQKAIAANLRKALGSPPPVKAEPVINITSAGAWGHRSIVINGMTVATGLAGDYATSVVENIRKALSLPAVTP